MRLASDASTAQRYSMNKAPASRADPTMSVAQCTPETNLATTMNAENAVTNIVVAFLRAGLFALLSTWYFSAGITLKTSSVVEDG